MFAKKMYDEFAKGKSMSEELSEYLGLSKTDATRVEEFLARDCVVRIFTPGDIGNILVNLGLPVSSHLCMQISRKMASVEAIEPVYNDIEDAIFDYFAEYYDVSLGGVAYFEITPFCEDKGDNFRIGGWWDVKSAEVIARWLAAIRGEPMEICSYPMEVAHGVNKEHGFITSGWTFVVSPSDGEALIADNTVRVYAGIVSHGTMRLQDIIPRFLTKIEELGAITNEFVGLFAKVSEHDPNDDDDPWWQSEDAASVCEEAIGLLDDIAPYGLYFGAYADSGSDFGYWQLSDDGE